MTGESPRHSLEEVFDVFRQQDSPGTPLTSTEVANHLAYDDETVTDVLQTLVGEGTLKTKEVGSQERIWWQSTSHSQLTETYSRFAHAQFQELVREITNYAIFVLDSDGFIQTWNAGAKRIKGYEREEIIGEHFSTLYTEEDRKAGRPERNLRRAAEHGRVEDEGERLRKDGSTFWANVTIAALPFGEAPRGYIKITRDMTERHEYEEQLAQERDRLEFINRLIRHNLLNDLNLVDARSDIIRRHTDPEGHHHVETVKERTGEMIDLVEKLRLMMKNIGPSEEQELEQIDLGSVLQKEVDQAQQTFDHAVIEMHGDVDQADHVKADELLEEVIENLLSNAVQHNDKDVPQVTVSIEQDEDMTTVRIADNGPGVSDQLKENVFKKGEKHFESPGTGFGLYFVKEIVESYGGSVVVEDNDPEGAVFSIRLPRN